MALSSLRCAVRSAKARIESSTLLMTFSTGLAGDRIGQLVEVLAHLVGEAAHQFHAGGERLRSPGREGPPRRFHCRIDVADSPAPQLRAGGRLVGHDHVPRPALAGLAVSRLRLGGGDRVHGAAGPFSSLASG
jgi:hypothetical protein